VMGSHLVDESSNLLGSLVHVTRLGR
jgi:hypothetical protein